MSGEVLSGERISHAIWDLAEANVSKDLEKENGSWVEAIWNRRKARGQVARKYNAARKVNIFRVGYVVVYRMKVLSSKGKGALEQLELKWSKPMVNPQILHNQPMLILEWCLRKLR